MAVGEGGGKIVACSGDECVCERERERKREREKGTNGYLFS